MKKHVSRIGVLLFATLCGFWMTSVHVQAATHTLQYRHHIENISKDSAGYDMGDINDHLVQYIDGVLVGTVTNHHMYGYVFAQRYGVSAYWNVDVYNADGTSSRTSWTSSSSPYTTSPAPSYVGQWNWNRYQSVSGGGHNSHLTTVKLKTFGASGSTTDNIYKVTASAFTEAGASIPYWAISVGGRALNSSGEAYLALADHSERDITPSVSGYSNYYFSIGATQIKPMIKWGGTDITGGTVATVVGLRPTLTLDTSAPVPITSYAWSVGGQRVENFVATSTNGGPVALTILTNSTVTFAWTDRGTGLDVSCTINVAGETATAKTKFNVFKPSSSVQTFEGAVGLQTLDGQLGIQYGSTFGTPGIAFLHNVNTGSHPGTIYWLQVIESTIREKTVGGQKQRFTASNVLDGGVIYGTSSPENDSPFEPVFEEEGFAHDQFAMFLMYKPNPAGSIAVPLRKIRWNWLGKAVSTSGNWAITQSSHSVPSNVETSVHPSWSGNVNPPNYVPVP